MPAAAGGEESSVVRPTMAALLRRLRQLLSDPNSEVWPDDEELQDVLDEANRFDWRYQALDAAESYAPGGAVQYLDFYSPAQTGGNWEGGVQLVNSVFAPLTAASENLVAGHWTFTQQPDGLQVYITGRTYDLYGAAADLLERDAAGLRRKFDVADASGMQARRKQMFDNALEMAAEYRSRQKARPIGARRSDAGAFGLGRRR